MRMVFLHVGSDCTLPAILVASFRKTHPDAELFNVLTRLVHKSAEWIRSFVSLETHRKLMTFRLSAFSKVGVEEPTLFLNSDMICLAPFDPERLLNGAPVAVCGRDLVQIAFSNFRRSK